VVGNRGWVAVLRLSFGPTDGIWFELVDCILRTAGDRFEMAEVGYGTDLTRSPKNCLHGKWGDGETDRLGMKE